MELPHANMNVDVSGNLCHLYIGFCRGDMYNMYSPLEESYAVHLWEVFLATRKLHATPAVPLENCIWPSVVQPLQLLWRAVCSFSKVQHLQLTGKVCSAMPAALKGVACGPCPLGSCAQCLQSFWGVVCSYCCPLGYCASPMELYGPVTFPRSLYGTSPLQMWYLK